MRKASNTHMRSIQNCISVIAVCLFCTLLSVQAHQSDGGASKATEAGNSEAPLALPLTGVTSSTQNPLQIAILHWYNANLTTSFAVGTEPVGVALDGANIWVTNFS